MADYGMEELAYEMNVAAAQARARGRRRVDARRRRTKPRFVAGAVGPTNRTASISPDVNDPGFRNVNFDELRDAYTEQVRGLIDGGADIILIETIFDTLNAKAAVFATLEVFEEKGVELPIMISGTITDRSGRTLSGQTPEAFWYSMRHLRPFSIGLNCALGARADAAATSPSCRACRRHAASAPIRTPGLPNAIGRVRREPGRRWRARSSRGSRDGLVNIVGGCCGIDARAHPRTSPSRAQEVTRRATFRRSQPRLRLSGLEPFVHR